MNEFPDGLDLASTPFKKFFFRLCSETGIDSERAKERVKEIYKLDSFSNVTKYQLMSVVERLKTIIAKNIIIKILEENHGKTPEEQTNALLERLQIEEKHEKVA